MSTSILLSHPLSPHLHLPKPKFCPPIPSKLSCFELKNVSLHRPFKSHLTDGPQKLRKLVLARVAEIEAERGEISPLVGEDSAEFVLSEQKISSWVYFTLVLGVVLYILNVAWIDNSTSYGKVFSDVVSSIFGSPQVPT